MGKIGLELVEKISDLTRQKILAHSLENFDLNMKWIEQGKGQSISKLRNKTESSHAVVLAAGPGLKLDDPASKLREFNGDIICCDSALFYCLRNGIKPNLVVCLDSNATRVVRWFGDPHLTKECLKKDDYFSRQEMDQDFYEEWEANQRVLNLVSEAAPGLKIALATSVAQSVTNRVFDAGFDVYWWNPMMDDPDHEESITGQMVDRSRLPALNAGGNVGAASYMMADALFSYEKVALFGFDFCYYPGTPYRNTQYYYEAKELYGEEGLEEFFIKVQNPYDGQEYYTDPTYYWYREAFLDIVGEADAKTFNCSSGGILFGEGLKFLSFDEFVKGI